MLTAASLRLAVAVVVVALAAGCGIGDGDGDGDGPAPPDDPPRLIPPGDVSFADLEAPETAGECEDDAGCEVSCVHACAPPATGPVTCPSEPQPAPARVEDAVCACFQKLCAWYETHP